MSIFDRIFGKKKITELPPESSLLNDLPPDVFFVEQFKSKGGKFLYTDNATEVLVFLKEIMTENKWDEAMCFDEDLINKLKVSDISIRSDADVFFTKCEYLIVEDGSLLFSSVQLKEERLIEYPVNFIVFATTSQLIKDKDKALTSIKFTYKTDIPTNISAIKDYIPLKTNPNFLNYGNNNSKNLYLLLFEDL